MTDPNAEFRSQVEALCRNVADRVDAVQLAVDAGLPTQPHPPALPANIYGTEGEWELYSTPSRDARLKAAFRELYASVLALPDRAARTPALRELWRQVAATADCNFAYRDSRGASVALSLDLVLDRLFALSFDPYHCPELRWGAAEGSAERASCPDDAGRLAWYRNERRLRLRVDRVYDVPTPLSFGPDRPPELDVRRVLGLRP